MPERILTGYGALSPVRQVLLLLIVSGALAGVVAGFLWSREPDMQVLFSNLTQEDAGAIVAKLREQKVPFIAEGAGTILVPTDKVHELRLNLAGQSLPQGGGVGFEIFDRTMIGMTDFVQKLNYRRALQGELARTIGQLAEVERARVHLSVPERSLFADHREKPRASVVLTFRRGKTLASGQIQGIAHLVASSVEGLQPQEVTVVDAHGQVLTKPTGDTVSQQTGAQLDAKQALEKDLETRVQSMLERVVGAGKAVVRVSSVLDLRQVERTEEAYDPNVQVVRSENRQQEKATSSSASGDGGVAGVGANVPGNAAPSSEGSSSNNSTRTNATVNYEINKTISRVVEPVGTIKRLTAAVMVDGSYEVKEGGDKDKKPERKYVPRGDEEMKKLEELVKNAIGYSEERGDQVQVLNVAFDATAVEVGEAGPAEPLPNPMIGQYVKYGVFVVLAMLVFLVVIRPLMRMLAESPSGSRQLALPAGSALPATVGQLEASLAPAQIPSGLFETARGNPQATAMVVKKWLKEK